MYRAVWLAIALCLAGTPACAQILSGHARVIDGDSLEIRGENIRLHGIDAPEIRQSCTDHTHHPYPCGQVAKTMLQSLIADASVSCQLLKQDYFRRWIAICFKVGHHPNPASLNALMVSRGHAMAYRRYSKEYIQQEAHAKQHHLGLWAGHHTPPWTWRRHKRQSKE